MQERLRDLLTLGPIKWVDRRITEHFDRRYQQLEQFSDSELSQEAGRYNRKETLALALVGIGIAGIEASTKIPVKSLASARLFLVTIEAGYLASLAGAAWLSLLQAAKRPVYYEARRRKLEARELPLVGKIQEK